MNILFFHRFGINPTAGGVSQITYVLSQEFQKQGYNVFFLGLQKVESVTYQEHQYFLPVENRLLSDENVDYLIRFCSEYHIDSIINQNALSLESAEFVSRVNGVYKISVIHNCIFTQYRNLAFQYEYRLKSHHRGWFFNLAKCTPVRGMITLIYILRFAKYYNQIADNCDVMSVMSQGQVDDLKIILNKSKWNKIVLIPNCINPKTFEWKPRSKNVLWVATIDFKIKRVDLMLKIWKLVQDNHSEWNLRILGDSSNYDEAKKYAEELGVKNVIFEGRVNPEAYYLDAQIACVTSTHESFSMVLIESFKYGVVPMAFDSFPAANEIINNGQDGVTVPAFDIKQYAAKLGNLMDDEIERERMRSNAYKSAKKYYSTNVFEKWSCLLLKAVPEKKEYDKQ